MRKLIVPRFGDFIDRTAVSITQTAYQLFTELTKRSNAAADVDALSSGNETADGSYNQTKQQALIDKVNELTNSLK